MKRIFIVTPSFNSAETIDRTILSIFSQSGDFEINYHVQDGGSTDGTVEKLKFWCDHLKNKRFPLLCNRINFTFSSRADKGMYSAIRAGFKSFDLNENDWMTWINADDILLPYAVSSVMALENNKSLSKSVSWLTGAPTNYQNGVLSNPHERQMSSSLIKLGLCDGKHWFFLQQEGTFFRNSLWSAIDTYNEFEVFTHAGDWNLWRLFAELAELYQLKYPLGVFTIREGQLSQSGRHVYEAELEAKVSLKTRTAAFQSLPHESIKARYLTVWSTSKTFNVEEKSISGHYKFRSDKLREASAARELDSPPIAKVGKAAITVVERSAIAVVEEPAIAVAESAKSSGPMTKSENDLVVIKNSIAAYDGDWQFPAITEQFAFERVLRFADSSLRASDVVYLGFPWATLIDLLNNKKAGASKFEPILRRLKQAIRGKKYVITVCQHILMLNYQNIFQELGITHIFWTHAVAGQPTLPKWNEIKILPFPLFPVQAVNLERNAPAPKRDLLYSFVGARSNKWYLTDSRNLILDTLAGDSRGLVVGRDQWHYHKAVYLHQVQGNTKVVDGLVDQATSDEFKKIMLRSVFSLCPSGSGPNSIRLWESIGFGSIPVVLADTYLPPGNLELWKLATVQCGETAAEIAALPDRLFEMAKDPILIAAKRQALAQLWLLYGPENFIHDIRSLFVKLSRLSSDGDTINVEDRFDDLLAQARKVHSDENCNAKTFRSFVLGCSGAALMYPKEFAEYFEVQLDIKKALSSILKDPSLVPQGHLSTLKKALDLRSISVN